MNRFTKIAILGASLMSFAPQPSYANDNYFARGYGLMNCRTVLSVPPQGQIGDLVMMAYVNGILNSMNVIATANGALTDGQDLVNEETTDNIVRMVKITCKRHPDMNFDESVLTIIKRINVRTEETN